LTHQITALNPILKIVLTLSAAGLLGAMTYGVSQETAKRPKNIIFMVGDGMGLGQITASMYAQRNNTVFDRFPVTGLMTTQSANHLITDSGAGATAFSCGCKTFNGAIGLDAKKHPCPTLLETADSVGMSTGIVVTCSITHATPASFFAHVTERSNMEEIAVWLVQNRIDFLIGGGGKYFNKRTKDKRNLVQEMEKTGYQVSTNRYDSIPKIPGTERPFFWITSDEEPPSVLKGRTFLPEMTQKGISFIQKRDNSRGFFMMVEGSQIDWAGHSNDKLTLIAEMADFEKAIANALDFAKKDGETLVVVTADHETGGMSILQGSNLDSLDLKFTSKGHTASMIPVFAYGPGADFFNGIYDNTDIFYKIKKAMGWN
jgi:alkaline phosphatase